jgi:hypothetical protein
MNSPTSFSRVIRFLTLASSLLLSAFATASGQQQPTSFGINAEKQASAFTVPVLKAIGGFSAETIANYEYDATHGHDERDWGNNARKPREPKKTKP